MYYAYVLKSIKDGRLYKGLTDDLEKRLRQHNLGQNLSTKGFIPWTLIYFEEFESRQDARNREIYFKSGQGREFLKDKLNL